MTMSIAAKHAKGKSAQDKIFGANAAAVAAAAKYGKDAVTNATIGAILDEDEKLVCLPTVEEVFRGLSTNEMIAYAPISGLPEYLDCVLTAAFGNSRPEGYISAVATAGGTGAIHHAIWNYTDNGDTVLCSDWYWGAYKVLCQDMGRNFTTYKMLDENNKYNPYHIEVTAVLVKRNKVSTDLLAQGLRYDLLSKDFISLLLTASSTCCM